MNEEELKQRESEQEEFQQMLKSSNQPKVPGGDGKKLYQVGCYTADDWQHIHEVLLEDGTLEDNIPKHSIECVDDKKISKTRAVYLLDDAEVESLTNHPKVKFVRIDQSAYPGSFEPFPDDML